MYKHKCAGVRQHADRGITLQNDILHKTYFEVHDMRKSYKLSQISAVLIVRPRGWHLDEPRVTVNAAPVSDSLFRIAMYFLQIPRLAAGSGPYFHLLKMEHYREAQLWNEVFLFVQSYIGIPQGTIRGTVLIKTPHAAFHMEEVASSRGSARVG